MRLDVERKIEEKIKKRKLKSMMLRYTSLHPEEYRTSYRSAEMDESCHSCGLLLMADYEYFR